MSLQRISPCLWFDCEAEEAARYYVSIFSDSRIGRIAHYTEVGRDIHGRPPGSVLTVEFELEGQSFTALNGGPLFKFNEAVSFQISCDTQEDIDYYWEKLCAGGSVDAQQCGWLKDRFGLSWQVVPKILPKLIGDPAPDKAGRVMSALMQMKKLDIAALERAHRGGSR